MYKHQTDCYCKEERLLFEVGNIFSSYFTVETTYLFVRRIDTMVMSMEDFVHSKENFVHNKQREAECLSSVNQALQVLGNKWAFLVLAQLYIRPQRFNQMRRQLGNISTKSLTDTLRHLEQNGIIKRAVFPTVPVTVEYSLTEKGEEFQAVIYGMYVWGHKWGKLENEPSDC
jgi:DNA-binding HxlR family transcriptional regulator